ncbi:MAG: glycosyltransferase family 4 protein [Oscillatoriales cyanobacterium RM1_1_9]|nr:glycosyltransferase family 4 protein [Oscillatoriales cyanobacterium SM2_3_0]NJO46160.1 glycosyltransferase family 4 protein [Oscillatoriales cyanobacterium RM2_1_1]NJO71280.1 glycosyltransferase family 4 protein [Oscillatoriales cyanobacterium RM1_1_9]
MKLLFITSTPPIPSWGGAMAFYRHLCERDDFQISVVTDNPQILSYSVPYEYTLINHGHIWKRLACSRFGKVAHSWSHLVGCSDIPAQIIEQAQTFGPDAILTVAGSWSWTAKLAGDVAGKLKLPLVGSFNDWWYYNTIRYPWLDPLLEQNFKRFYRQCDLALCTSEGMRDALGSHPNAVVLYPTGASMPAEVPPIQQYPNPIFTVAFGGNLGDWYGRMLEALVTRATGQPIAFKFFGSNPSWSSAFDTRVRDAGIYQGQVSFEQLRQEMQQVDALLLLMGFEQTCAQIERTSFKTKFLDYLSFRKPILLWGPDYCSAVGIAQEFDSAEICTSPRAEDFLATIERLQNRAQRQEVLLTNAQKMYEERFHPDKIHQIFVTQMKQLIAQP